MPLATQELHDLISLKITQQGSSDRITGAELRRVLDEIVNSIESVTSLGAFDIESTTSNGLPYTYIVGQGFLLDKILIKAAIDIDAASAETEENPNSGDIVMPESVTAFKGAEWDVNVMAWTPRNIVLKGLPAGAIMYFLKIKIL